jgi:hypothetical protein
MHAVNAARNLLRGSSSTNLIVQRERPASADIKLEFTSEDGEDEDESAHVVFDMDEEGVSPRARSSAEEGVELSPDGYAGACSAVQCSAVYSVCQPEK